MTFGTALGIVEFSDSGFSILKKERLREARNVATVLELIEHSAQSDLSIIYNRLAEPPIGLTKEAAG
jgi:hypothetical protein